jgi:hypothetical protein
MQFVEDTFLDTDTEVPITLSVFIGDDEFWLRDALCLTAAASALCKNGNQLNSTS